MPSPMVGASDRMRIRSAGCVMVGGLSGDRTGNSGNGPLWQAGLRLHRAGSATQSCARAGIGQARLPSGLRRISTPVAFHPVVMPGLGAAKARASILFEEDGLPGNLRKDALRAF